MEPYQSRSRKQQRDNEQHHVFAARYRLQVAKYG